MAMEVLKEVSADDQLRTKTRLQEKAENDWKARIYYAKQEGIAKGRAEGRAEGEAMGVAKGEHQKQLEIARKALAMLDDAAVAQLTGLALDEVAFLRTGQK